MSQKSRILAWELVRLLGGHSEKDISRAISLLTTGKLFQDSLGLLDNVRLANVRPPQAEIQSHDGDLAQTSPIEKETVAVEDSVIALKIPDEAAILRVLHGIRSGELLRSSRHLRELGGMIGIEFSNKMPSRAIVARRIVERIIQLPQKERFEVISATNKMSNDDSSLKGWSDLIVKS